MARLQIKVNTMNTKALLLFWLISPLLLLSACKKEIKTTFSLNNVALLAEGPLTEGSNTAQGTVKEALAAFLKEHNLTPEQITNVKLTKAVVHTPDSVGFDLVKSITLQLASDDAEMVEAGVVNPIPAGAKMATLQLPAEPKNMLYTLKQNTFTLVADLDIKQDTSMNFPLTGDLEFEVTHH